VNFLQANLSTVSGPQNNQSEPRYEKGAGRKQRAWHTSEGKQ